MLSSREQKPYQYRKLDDTDSIRLLHIQRSRGSCNGYDTQPGQSTDHDLRLIETSLAKAPPYQTVSYTWGDLDRRTTLSLADAVTVDVTENLSTALPYLLGASKHDYLWVDQVCINQADLDERAQQVSMMGQIYENGDGVLVFLCEGRQANPLLRDILRTIDFPMGDCKLSWGVGAELRRPFRLIQTLLGGHPEVDKPKRWDTDPLVRAFQKHHSLGEDEGRDVSWPSLRQMISEIFTSRWFSRVWVVQEAVLSQEVVFLVGSTAVSARQIGIICQSLRDWAETHDIFHDWSGSIEMQGFRMLLHLMDLQQEPHGDRRSLYGFLGVLRTSLEGVLQATDPRDIIYGILGLTHSGNMSDIVPDYRMPVHLLFASIARLLVFKHRSLEILCTCDGIDRSGAGLQRRGSAIEREQILPSWVPNWTTALTFQVDYPVGPVRQLRAGGTSRPHASTQMSPWNQLPVRGRIVATIGQESCVDVDQVKICFYAAFFQPVWFRWYMQEIQNTLRGSILNVERGADISKLLRAVLYWYLRNPANRIKSVAEDVDEVVRLYEQIASIGSYNSKSVVEAGDYAVDATSRVDVQQVYRDFRKHVDNMKSEQDSHPQIYDWGLLDRGYVAVANCPFDAFYWTSDGRLVLTFSKVRPEDEIGLLHGYRNPVILGRQTSGMHKYVTSCFCEDAMETTAMDWAEEDAEDLVLI